MEEVSCRHVSSAGIACRSGQQQWARQARVDGKRNAFEAFSCKRTTTAAKIRLEPTTKPTSPAISAWAAESDARAQMGSRWTESNKVRDRDQSATQAAPSRRPPAIAPCKAGTWSLERAGAVTGCEHRPHRDPADLVAATVPARSPGDPSPSPLTTPPPAPLKGHLNYRSPSSDSLRDSHCSCLPQGLLGLIKDPATTGKRTDLSIRNQRPRDGGQEPQTNRIKR